MSNNNILSIKSKVDISDEIRDKRQVTFGMSFGTIYTIAEQYGIYIEQDGEWLIFTAPKDRLRLFAEKLYFGDVSFYEV